MASSGGHARNIGRGYGSTRNGPLGSPRSIYN